MRDNTWLYLCIYMSGIDIKCYRKLIAPTNSQKFPPDRESAVAIPASNRDCYLLHAIVRGQNSPPGLGFLITS